MLSRRMRRSWTKISRRAVECAMSVTRVRRSDGTDMKMGMDVVEIIRVLRPVMVSNGLFLGSVSFCI